MHRIRRTTLPAIAGAIALAMAGGAVAADNGNKNKHPKVTDAYACEGDDQIVFNGAKELWPPNHKYQDVSVSAIGDSETEGVTINTTVTSSQDEFAIGSGNTAMDVMPPANSAAGNGEATVSHAIRSERAGGDKEGRTYTIDVMATFDDGTETCETTYTVHVAHDQRGGASWKL